MYVLLEIILLLCISGCDCNEQADTCDRESGVCYCRTRGVIGDKCDK
jgi:hypothetical protein